jgi:hypothetical protein
MAARVSVLTFGIVALLPGVGAAQAWVPPKGEGAVSVIYQNMLVREHVFSDGGRIDAGHIFSNNVMVDFGYGLTDRIALNVSLPYIASRYDGEKPHPNSRLDDGRIHGTFQDFRINVRYGWITGPVTVTPFVDFIVPSSRYDYYGHAAPGRRLAEVQFGAYVGYVLRRGLPGTFVQARYSYGLPQRPLGVYHDRSNTDMEFGYFIHPKLRVFALTATQYTHGGIELTRQFPNDLSQAERLHHDQISKTQLVDVGGGAQFAITPRVNLFASYATTVVGRSGHALGRGISIGASWGFGRRSSGGGSIGGDAISDGLAKCLCKKGAS